MSSIIANTLSILATYLAAQTGVDAYVGWLDQDRAAVLPSITIIKRNTTYTSCNPGEVEINDSGSLVKMGELISDLEIRINSIYAVQRQELEDTVIRSFMRNPLNRGCVTLPIPAFAIDGYTYSIQLYASFDLQNTNWVDELVFTRPRYSFVHITGQSGVYVGTTDVTIQEIDLCINNDLSGNSITDETIITTD